MVDKLPLYDGSVAAKKRDSSDANNEYRSPSKPIPLMAQQPYDNTTPTLDNRVVTSNSSDTDYQ